MAFRSPWDRIAEALPRVGAAIAQGLQQNAATRAQNQREVEQAKKPYRENIDNVLALDGITDRERERLQRQRALLENARSMEDMRGFQSQFERGGDLQPGQGATLEGVFGAASPERTTPGEQTARVLGNIRGREAEAEAAAEAEQRQQQNLVGWAASQQERIASEISDMTTRLAALEEQGEGNGREATRLRGMIQELAPLSRQRITTPEEANVFAQALEGIGRGVQTTIESPTSRVRGQGAPGERLVFGKPQVSSRGTQVTPEEVLAGAEARVIANERTREEAEANRQYLGSIAQPYIGAASQYANNPRISEEQATELEAARNVLQDAGAPNSSVTRADVAEAQATVDRVGRAVGEEELAAQTTGQHVNRMIASWDETTSPEQALEDVRYLQETGMWENLTDTERQSILTTADRQYNFDPDALTAEAATRASNALNNNMPTLLEGDDKAIQLAAEALGIDPSAEDVASQVRNRLNVRASRAQSAEDLAAEMRLLEAEQARGRPAANAAASLDGFASTGRVGLIEDLRAIKSGEMDAPNAWLASIAENVSDEQLDFAEERAEASIEAIEAEEGLTKLKTLVTNLQGEDAVINYLSQFSPDTVQQIYEENQQIADTIGPTGLARARRTAQQRQWREAEDNPKVQEAMRILEQAGSLAGQTTAEGRSRLGAEGIINLFDVQEALDTLQEFKGLGDRERDIITSTILEQRAAGEDAARSALAEAQRNDVLRQAGIIPEWGLADYRTAILNLESAEDAKAKDLVTNGCGTLQPSDVMGGPATLQYTPGGGDNCAPQIADHRALKQQIQEYTTASLSTNAIQGIPKDVDLRLLSVSALQQIAAMNAAGAGTEAMQDFANEWRDELRRSATPVSLTTPRTEGTITINPQGGVREGAPPAAGPGLMDDPRLDDLVRIRSEMRLTRIPTEGEGPAAGLGASREYQNLVQEIAGDYPGVSPQDIEGALERRRGRTRDNFTFPGQDEPLFGPRREQQNSGIPEVDRVWNALTQQESRGVHVQPGGAQTESNVGARGIAQIMPATALEPGYGMAPLINPPENIRSEASRLIAEKNAAENREDYPERDRLRAEINEMLAPYMDQISEADNREFGRNYLTALYNQFGDIRKALAAYNAGADRVAAAERAGGENWLDLLPSETRAYVPNILRIADGS